MHTKETLAFTCPCEKEHTFSATYLVAGAGRERVQVRCPHPQCPSKNPLLSFEVPHQLVAEEGVFKQQEGRK